MEGYLMKRGGKTDRKWQRRYCALELLQDANMYVITYRVKKGVRAARNAVFVIAWSELLVLPERSTMKQLHHAPLVQMDHSPLVQ